MNSAILTLLFLLLFCFVAIMFYILLMLTRMAISLRNIGTSLSKIEQYLGDTEEEVKVDKQTQPVVTDNVDDSA